MSSKGFGRGVKKSEFWGEPQVEQTKRPVEPGYIKGLSDVVGVINQLMDSKDPELPLQQRLILGQLRQAVVKKIENPHRPIDIVAQLPPIRLDVIMGK